MHSSTIIVIVVIFQKMMAEELRRQDALIRDLTTRGSSETLGLEPKYGEGMLQLFEDEGVMFIYGKTLCLLLQNFH